MAARARWPRNWALPFLGEIPLVPSIRETSDAGTPIVALDPEGREAAAFLAVAQGVALTLQGPARAAPRDRHGMSE